MENNEIAQIEDAEKNSESVQRKRTSYKIVKAKAKGKKLSIKITYVDDNNKERTKTINVGQIGFRDYPQVYAENTELAESLKELYLKRNKNSDYTNTLSKQFWSRYLLWNKPTLSESVEYIRTEFHADITLEDL